MASILILLLFFKSSSISIACELCEFFHKSSISNASACEIFL